MKKRYMTIEEYKNPLGAYTITINNVRYHKTFFDSITEILKEFLEDGELFFGFYRTDGVNLTYKRQKELKKEISVLFQTNGTIEDKGEYLSVAKIHADDYIYNYIPLIFDYYLETLVFNSKVNWEIFKEYHFDYQRHRYDDLIINNFAELIFFYFDSGDFSVCFNPRIYDPEKVRSIIDKKTGNTGDGSSVNTGELTQGTVLCVDNITQGTVLCVDKTTITQGTVPCVD